MPGVVISTAVRSGPTGNTTRESSQAFFAGITERGPADQASKVNSMEEYEALYGGYVSNGYLHDTVKAFFEEGGTQCYVARVTGANPVTSYIELDDVNADSALQLTANGPGTWVDDLNYEVVIGVAANSSALRLYWEGTMVYNTGDCLSLAQMVGRINTSAIASRYVTAEITGTLMPAPVASTAFPTTNADNSVVSDGGAPGDNQYSAALDLFLNSFGTGVVGCPETTSAVVRDALIAHANTNNRMSIHHYPAGTTAVTAGANGRSEALGAANGEHAAVFYPWVYVPTSTPGINRLIPPLGYAAGVRSRAHNQVGPQQPGAGIISNARYVNGIEFALDKSAGDALDEAHVNAIRTINNTIRIYGARSLSSDTSNFRYMTAQDLVNHVVVEANRTLEDLLFSVIDGRNNIFASVEAKLIAVLEPLRLAGALYEAFDANGKRIDYGYTVKCDTSLNPVTQLADGLIKAKVGIRVSSVGDKIEVDIVKSNLTNSVV